MLADLIVTCECEKIYVVSEHTHAHDQLQQLKLSIVTIQFKLHFDVSNHHSILFWF